MACIITYKNNKYSQQEFEKYFKNNFNEFINEFLSQDIEGFKTFVNSSSIDVYKNSLKDEENSLSLPTEEDLGLNTDLSQDDFKC